MNETYPQTIPFTKHALQDIQEKHFFGNNQEKKIAKIFFKTQHLLS